MRVRVCDDNADIAELLRLELTYAGFDVEVRSRGFFALLAPGAWDGIAGAVLDVMLGEEVSGLHLLFHLANHEPQVRRVLLTASIVGELDRRIADVAHVVLEKPVPVTKVVEALRG